MKDKIRYVGLDVHKDSISIAVADAGGGEPEVLATIRNELTVLLKHLKKIGPSNSLLCCYEAGPTGYGRVVKIIGHAPARRHFLPRVSSLNGSLAFPTPSPSRWCPDCVGDTRRKRWEAAKH
jgi:hypothetical protein